MNIQTLLFIVAAVCFALDAFRVPTRVGWTPLAFCFLTIALFLI